MHHKVIQMQQRLKEFFEKVGLLLSEWLFSLWEGSHWLWKWNIHRNDDVSRNLLTQEFATTRMKTMQHWLYKLNKFDGTVIRLQSFLYWTWFSANRIQDKRECSQRRGIENNPKTHRLSGHRCLCVSLPYPHDDPLSGGSMLTLGS